MSESQARIDMGGRPGEDATSIAQREGGAESSRPGQPPVDRSDPAYLQALVREQHKLGGRLLPGRAAIRAEAAVREQELRESRERALERQKREEELRDLDKRTSVEIPSRDGEAPQGRESLPKEVQGWIIEAQRALVAKQGEIDFSHIKEPREREEAIAKRKEQLARENRIIVLNGGETIMLVQGDPRGLKVRPDGKSELIQWEDTRKQRVERRLANGDLAKDSKGKQLYDEVSIPIGNFDHPQKVSSVTFKSGVTHVPGKEDVPYVLATTKKAKDQGRGFVATESPVPNPGDTREIFRDLVNNPVVMNLSKDRVLDLGPNGAKGRTEADTRRIAHKLVDIKLGDVVLAEGQILIGAGSEFLGRGKIELGNDILPSGEAIAREATLVFTSSREMTRYSNLTLAERNDFARSHLGEQLSAYRDVKTVVGSADQAAEGNFVLQGDDILDDLDARYLQQVDRTRRIIEGAVPLADISDQSELMVALMRGQEGFSQPRSEFTAMARANEYVLNLRNEIDTAESNGEDRRIATVRLVGELLQNQGVESDERTRQVAERLVSTLAKRDINTAMEHVLDAMDRYKSGLGDREDFEKASRAIIGVLLEQNVDSDTARRITEAVLPRPTEVLAMDRFAQMIREGVLSRVDAQAMLDGDVRIPPRDKEIMQMLVNGIPEQRDIGADYNRIVSGILGGTVLTLERAMGEIVSSGLPEDQKTQLERLARLEFADRDAQARAKSAASVEPQTT